MSSWPDIYNDNSRTYWEIKNAFSTWLSTNSNDNIFLDTIHKTKNYKNFRRFEALHETKLDSNGTFNSYQKEMMSYLEEHSNKSSTHCFGDDWKFINYWNTPDDVYGAKGMGIVHDLWVNPYDTNHILAATPNGGLWKTTDGGTSWKNITDTIGLSIGVSTIAVNPLNTDVIYIGTGAYSYVTVNNGYGIYKSTNGGDSWMPTSLSLTGSHLGFVKKIINPIDTNKVFAITYRNYNLIYPNGFYRSNDGFQTNTYKYIYNPFDIILQPNNPNKLSIISRDSIYYSSNGGGKF